MVSSNLKSNLIPGQDVNDQTGFVDIGDTRFQRGRETISSDPAVTVTLPAPFKDETEYVVTTGIDLSTGSTGATVGIPVVVEAFTKTTFDLDRSNNIGGTIIVHWHAVGKKP